MRPLVVAIVMLFSAPALCADVGADGMISVYGLGNTSCGMYVEARREGPRSLGAHFYASWADGYVTAANGLIPDSDIQEGVDLTGRSLWLENYCVANPTVSFHYAVAQFLIFRRPDVVRR